jgi:hypothetical protein
VVDFSDRARCGMAYAIKDDIHAKPSAINGVGGVIVNCQEPLDSGPDVEISRSGLENRLDRIGRLNCYWLR